jgi:hypothetical protein
MVENYMDKNNLQQVFEHYIENFAMVNDAEHEEYYKWQVCAVFHDLMDAALAASDSEFSAALYQAKTATFNIIDSYTQPFYGLVKYAEEEPQTVRRMFVDLYASDGGDLTVRMEKIAAFFEKSSELLEKYFPGSYLYRQNSHSVSAYLFLYDPDNHYMYKATECKTMADCIGFYDDWGSGDNIRLDVFYRMCDEIVDGIQHCPELLATNESRYDGSLHMREGKLHPDKNKHILLFDIIYCCQTYDLFGIIPFAKPDSKEKKLILEYRQKAVRLKEAFDEAKKTSEQLDKALDCFTAMLKPGVSIRHKKYGKGVISSVNRSYLLVKFLSETEEKRLGLPMVIANGIITCDQPGFDEKSREYKTVLSRAQNIPKALDYAAKTLEPYEEYLPE